MGKEIANRIIAIFMVFCPTFLVGCGSDEDVFELGFMTSPNVDESIALAMAAGTYECAFELDTVRCYSVENDEINEFSISMIEGVPLPRRGDYFEIRGSKAYCIMKIVGWWNMLKDELDEYAKSDSDEAHDCSIYTKSGFSYDIMNSCLYESESGNLKYVVMSADGSQMVIRRTTVLSNGDVTYWDYYYDKTSPRDVSNSFESYEDAKKDIESRYVEIFGQDKFNEMKENWGWFTCV